jgi:YD repeat-containing protein
VIKTHRFNSTIPSSAVYPANAGNAGYQYDQNGNMIQKNNGCLPGACRGQIVNYIYNADNRLIEVKDGSNNTVATYTYNPYGRRIKKQTGVGGQL